MAQGVSDERAMVTFPVIDLARFESCPDIEEFKQKEALTGKLILLSVGRVIPRKGFDRVVKVLPRILAKFPQVVYVIVGEGDPVHGDATTEIKHLIDELALNDYVRLVGNRDVIKFFHACDINVMPSLYDLDKLYVETFGITFLEANACKKPVIGGNTGGMTDAVSDGESGLLVDVDDLDALAEAIERLLGDPELRHTLGQQGFERVKREFTIESWRNRLPRIYENI